MSAGQKAGKVTLEEYFAIEERAERKSEYYNGEMFLMAGPVGSTTFFPEISRLNCISG
jgi:hypothetical protein